jgi:excisionase family DNA binding protein
VAVKPLLTGKEAAEKLGLKTSWVMAEARANRIPHVRLGKYVRFDEDDLEKWAKDRVQGHSTDRP